MSFISRYGKLVREPSLTYNTTVDAGGTYGRDPAWHPTENYVVGLCDSGGKELAVYHFDGSSLTEKDSFNLGAIGRCADWHKDGIYVAVGSDVTDNELRMYSWDSVTETLTLEDTHDMNAVVFFVKWSNDGNYLVVGSATTSKQLSIFSFNGTILTEEETVDIGANVYNASWSRYDDYLAVGKHPDATNELEVYSWNSGTKTLASAATYSTGNTVYLCEFMHSNNYIIINSGSTLRMVSFNGSTLTSVETVDLSSNLTGIIGGAVYRRFIYLGGHKSAGGDTPRIYIYEWDEQAETLTQVDTINRTDQGEFFPRINYNKKYLATAPYDTNSNTLNIFSL